MQVLTPSGYVDIIDLNIGDEVIAYDINTGAQIINHLEGKTLWTPDMYPAEYTVGHYDENGDWVPPVLVNTSYEVFQRIQGDWFFYRINGTFDFYKSQSIWTNMNVVHVSDLQVGDVIYNDLDEDIIVTSIEQVEHSIWWKLDVSGDSSYIADGITFHNASRYWVGGGSSNTWAATGNTNWSSTSGGANNASVPTSVDAVTFDNLGNSDSVISAGITVLSLSITSGYTATMTHNALLQVAGNITFGANYTIAGTSILQLNTTSTITSNGKTWPNSFVLSMVATVTLVGDFTVNGILYVGPYNQSPSIPINKTTTEKLIVNGGLAATQTNGPNYISGTAALDFYGSTWSGVQVANQMTVYGTVALSGSNLGAGGAFINLGTINAGTSTFNLGTSPSFNSNGATWNNITVGFSNPTLSSDLIVNGTYAAFGGSYVYKTTNESIYVYGGFTTYYENSTFGGTATVILKGGTWTTTFNNTPFAMPITIDGNITISGVKVLKSGSTALRYISGVVTTTGSTLRLGDCSMFLSGTTLNNIGIEGTVTLGENLFVSGITTVTSPATLNKTASEKLVASGGLTMSSTLAGTGTIELTGGTWSGTSTLSTPLTFNGNSVISGTVQYGGSLVTYTSGTITAVSSGNITLPNSTQTISFNVGSNMQVPLTFIGGTKTLSTNFSTGGLVNITANTTVNKTTTETFTLYGGISISNDITLSGTTKLIAAAGAFFSYAGGGIAVDVDIAGNITVNSNLTIRGTSKTLKYVSGAVTGAGTLWMTNNTIIDVIGTIINAFVFDGTIRLASDTICNSFTTNGGATLNKTTTETLTVYGNITIANNGISGTAEIIAKGGSITTGTNSFIGNPLTLDGNITFVGNVLWCNPYVAGTTLKYLSGTNNSSVTDLKINGQSNIDTSSISWGLLTINIGFSGTLTLISNLNILGVTTITNIGNINTSTSAKLITGGIAANTAIAGTSTIELTGGTWSGTNTTGISNNLNINGNVTISGNVYYRTGTITYVSGTPIVTGSTLNTSANTTFNTGAMMWNNVTINTGAIHTLNSDLNVGGLLSSSVGGGTSINTSVGASLVLWGGINISNTFQGTATVVAKGGTFIGGLRNNFNIDGNIAFSGTFNYLYGTMTYLSGNVSTIGSTLNGTGFISNTKGIIWNNFTLSDIVTLTSDMTIDGLFTNANGSSVNKTTNEILYVRGGMNIANSWMRGNGTIYLQSGTWTQTAIRNLECDTVIDGNVIFGANCAIGAKSLTYQSGTITGGPLNIVAACTLLNFHKCPIRNVIVTAAVTFTMNQFFTGTPTTPASIVASTAAGQYTIAFTDSFERIATNVIISGCVLSKPMQLIVSPSPRVNVLRTTNSGVRYNNQSPNGFSKNTPAVTGLATGPALGLAGDPCFIKQS